MVECIAISSMRYYMYLRLGLGLDLGLRFTLFINGAIVVGANVNS